jgi:membrane-associated phospholipid phosphatase
MTAAAVGLPLGTAIPHIFPAIMAVWLAIAWSRVALGHHYPSDLVFGGVLGLVIAAPITMIMVV